MERHFPENIDESLRSISKLLKLELEKNTHYNSFNRELSLFKGNTRMRIDFEYDSANQHIDVTLLKDIFPFFPRLLISAHNIIPSCPAFFKISWEHLDILPLNKDSKFYSDKIYSFIDIANKELLSESIRKPLVKNP